MLSFISVFALGFNVQAAPGTFVFQGQIVKPNSEVLEEPSVDFTIEIYSPTNECLLYREYFNSVDMSGSNGQFNFAVGSGTRSGADPADSAALLTMMDNSQGNFAGLTCTSGSNYDPNPGDIRKMRVTFNDGSGAVTVAQDYNIQSVPYAQYASSLQGLGPTDFVNINTGSADVSQASLETVFAAPADTTELRNLIDGSSAQYISSSPGAAVNLNGQILENIAAPDSDDDAVNRGWANDNIAGNDASGIGVLGVGEQDQFLQWNGSAWVMADIATIALVDGGNSTGSTINLGTNDANDLVLETNNTARLTVGSNGGVLIDSLGVTGSALLGAQMQLQDGDTNFVAFQANPAMAADVVFTLPDADGTNNQVLFTDGSGNLGWKDDAAPAETDPRMLTLTAGEVNQLENIDTNTITNAQWGYLANMGGQPLESFTELDPGLQTLSTAEVDQLENIDTNTITNAQWGYIANMGGQPLESESDPGLQTLSTAEVDQLENIDTNTITNAQWGYIANMGGQPLESFTESDPGLQTLSAAEVDQLENIDTNTITNAQWGYLANMGGQPLESFTEADTLANVTGRGANTADDIQLDSQAELRLGDDDNSNYVGLRAPAGMTANQLFTLPAADGTSAQILATDGSGNFYWKNDAGAGSGLSVGDVLPADAGTVGAPGITFDGDTDNGLYLPAADQVGFVTGGTERMLIPNDGTITILGNSITATEMGYLSSMTAQPLESESDPGLQTLTTAEVDQLENIDTNTITNAQWGYLANMGGQPLESFTELDPGLQTLSTAEVDQLENIDTNTITNAQWGYLANMGGQPLESESDPGLQTLTTAEVDQLENIDTNTITNAQWGYLANMGGQPLESFTEADDLDSVVGRGASTTLDMQLDNQAEMRFGDDDNSNFVSLSAPAGMSANAAFVLPSADGTNNQVLATDGSGNFFWKNDAGAGAGLSVGDTLPAADGTVGAPSVTFDNDNDNGLFLSGTNEVGFVSGGTERMILLNDGTITMLGNNITATEFGYLSSMTAQPLESESDPGLQTLSAAEVDQLENIDTNTITNAQWGYLANMGGQPLESESDPGLQTLSAAEVDQLENIDTNTITNAQWGYLANMGGQPLESFTELDPGLQTLSAAEVDQLENIDTNTITNAQWGYLANMGGQPLESFTEADTLANVTGRGANTSDDIQLDSQAEMRFGDDDNSNVVALRAPSGMSADQLFTLPASDGTNNQVLATDGSGNFFWKNDAGAGAGLSVGDTIPAADGTVGAPSLTFDNDNDNGLFLSGTNEVGFVSGGTERMILLNDGTLTLLGNNITATEFGYLSSMTAQPLESESDPGLQTLSAAEVDQLENIDTNTITNAQWGYLANMGGQPLESESDPGLQTLSAAEVDQLENIDTNTITNAQWGYLANMGGQPLESFTESDPGLQTLSVSEVDQLENIDTNTITNAQWGYLANMGGQPLESFTEADDLDSVVGRGASTTLNMQLDNQAEMRFGDDDNSNFVSLSAPAGMSANAAFVLPSADGTSNQVLATDGSGNFFWKNDAGAGSGLSSGDVLDGANGAVGAPGLTFTADTDTGLYRSAANELSFSTGGTQRALIDATGNVGINTTAATRSLSIGVGSNSEGINLIRDTNAAELVEIRHQNGHGAVEVNDGNGVSIVYLTGEGSDNYILRDFGIREASPEAVFEISADGGATDPLMVSANDSGDGDLLIVKNSGNVGIGTTVPGETLDVDGNAWVRDELRLANDANTNFVALKTPDASTSSVTFTLPDADGTSGQVLQTDGSGVLSWATPAGGGYSAGDTIWVASGSTASPGLAFNADQDTGLAYDLYSNGSMFLVKDGIPYVEINDSWANPIGFLDYVGMVDNRGIRWGIGSNAAIWGNNSGNLYFGTVNTTQGQFDSSGNLNLLTENELRFQDAADGNYVGFKAPAALTGADVVWTLPDGDGTSGQVLQTDGSGVLSWTTASGGDFQSDGSVSMTDTLTIAMDGDSGNMIVLDDTAGGNDRNVAINNNGERFTIRNLTDGQTFLQAELDSGTMIIGDSESDDPDAVVEISADGGATDLFMLSSDAGNDGDLLVVKNNGDVGIGTTSPDDKVHIWSGNAGAVSALAAADDLVIENSGDVGMTLFSPDSNSAQISFGDPDNDAAGAIEYQHSGDTLVFDTGGISRVDINASGINMVDEHSVNFFDSGSTNFVGFRAPATVDANVTWTLPDADGTSGQVLSTDGSGALSWSTPAAAGASAIDGLSDGKTSGGGTDVLYLGTNAGAANAAGGDDNIGIGIDALAADTTGDWNIAIGHQALDANDGGSRNIAIGPDVLSAETSSTYNMAMGFQAMQFTNGSDYNTALGYSALREASSGDENVAVGSSAMQENQGSQNVAIGNEAAYGAASVNLRNVVIGYQAGQTINTADDNVLLGYQAGRNLTTGDSNIMIGSGVNPTTSTSSDQLNIGNTIYGDLSSDLIGIGRQPTFALDVVNSSLATRSTRETAANTVVEALQVEAINTGGAGGNGLGASISFSAETSTTNGRDIGQISTYLTDATDATRTATMAFYTVNSASMTPKMTIAGNGDVAIGTAVTPGKLNVGGAVLAAGGIWLGDDNDDNYVGFQSPATVNGSVVWTLPDADGTANQVLQTNGSGVLSWVTQGAGSIAIDDLTDGDTTSGTGADVLMLGSNNLNGSATGDDVIVLGNDNFGAITSGYNNILVGHKSAQSMDNQHNMIIMGHNTATNVETGSMGIMIGNDLADENDNVNGSTVVGHRAWGFSTGTLQFSVGIGNYTFGNVTGSADVLESVAVGESALNKSSGDYNVAIGYASMDNITSGNYNTAVGHEALNGAISSSSANNTVIGHQSGNAIDGGNNNTMIGFRAGRSVSSGANNILLGYLAGDNLLTGSNNILIGDSVDTSTTSVSNELNIGNAIYGNLSTGNIGIGTSAPSQKLHVNGNLKVDGSAVGTVVDDADALSALTVDFTNTNMIRATGASAACGTLNVQNVAAGGTYTLTILNATANCTTVQLNGSTANVKLPSSYSGGTTVAGVVYSFLYDGTTLWVSEVHF